MSGKRRATNSGGRLYNRKAVPGSLLRPDYPGGRTFRPVIRTVRSLYRTLTGCLIAQPEVALPGNDMPCCAHPLSAVFAAGPEGI